VRRADREVGDALTAVREVHLGAIVLLGAVMPRVDEWSSMRSNAQLSFECSPEHMRDMLGECLEV